MHKDLLENLVKLPIDKNSGRKERARPAQNNKSPHLRTFALISLDRSLDEATDEVEQQNQADTLPKVDYCQAEQLNEKPVPKQHQEPTLKAHNRKSEKKDTEQNKNGTTATEVINPIIFSSHLKFIPFFFIVYLL